MVMVEGNDSTWFTHERRSSEHSYGHSYGHSYVPLNYRSLDPNRGRPGVVKNMQKIGRQFEDAGGS